MDAANYAFARRRHFVYLRLNIDEPPHHYIPSLQRLLSDYTSPAADTLHLTVSEGKLSKNV
jgi:hypothetical protein